MNSAEHIRGGVQAPPRTVVVMGVGNLLLTDDGFGVHVINALKETDFPSHIKLIEAGVVSHQLIPLFHEIDVLIVIDSVEAGDAPGSIFRFSPEELQFKTGHKSSLHQLSLIDVLQMTELTGKKPETIIIAVQPKDITSWSLELTDEIKSVIPRVKELVFDELKRVSAL